MFRLFMAEEDPRVRETFHQFIISLLQSYSAKGNGLYCRYTFNHLRKCFPIFITSDVLALTITQFSDILVDYESQNQFTSAVKMLSNIALDYTPHNYPIQWGLVFSDVSLCNIYNFL